ncbi:MAG: ABC transporter ATP-binding protein [Patescibacteria group bacterium]|jgi:ATP-binding cassette subfamily B multidrug efflux pump
MNKQTNSKHKPTSPQFTLRRGHGISGPAEKPKDFKGTMQSLLKRLRSYRLAIIGVIVLALASTIFSIISPKILGDITNTIVSGQSGSGIAFGRILSLVKLLLTLYLLSLGTGYLHRWLMAGVTQKITFSLRHDIAAKINRLPLSYYDRQTHGEILSRVTNDVDTVSQSLDQSLTQLVSAMTTLVGVIVMMFLISWQLSLVALIVMPLGFLFVKFVIKRSQKQFLRQQRYLGEINGHIEEMFSGHLVVKAYNGEERSIRAFKKINDQLQDSAWKSQFFSGLLMPVMNFIGNLGYVAVAVLGAWLTLQGRLSIGGIQAFIQYLRQFNHPIAQTANIANVLQSTAAAAERVFEFLSEPEQEAEVSEPLSVGQIRGQVEFDQVNFSYLAGEPVIKDFSINIQPGQRVAIVGPTGAGKTTLVNLLMRFYELDSGEIRIDGLDIKQLKRSDLRSLFGMVLQDAWLFKGTIKENIAYGRAEASTEEIYQAAITARADHFIRTLPDAYNLIINEEADNISQGEKQLITIARAMLTAAPILILDEATSSVDTRTEILIQEAMERLMKGRTSFVIAHRLSTIKNADLILMIEEGRVVEQGSHQELLAKQGAYAALYYSQFALQAN